MRVDNYTKLMLTIIAGTLLWLCAVLTPVGTPVQAQAPGQVVLVGWKSSDGAIHSFSMTEGLPVRVAAVAGTAVTSPAQPQPSNYVSPLLNPAPSSTTTPKTGERIRCQATTQKGTQCSRLAEVGSSYCWQHRR